MIFIHLSQSWHGKPPHRIVPILGSGVPRSGSIRAKKFLVCTGKLGLLLS